MFWSFKPLLAPRGKRPFSGCYWITSFERPQITRLGDNYTLSFSLLNTCTVLTRCKNRHTYISHLRRRISIDIYLIIFIYLFRLIYFMLCTKWKCTLVGSHWYYGVFIYMISTSYFLGKDAHQVNGFVQDFLILLFNPLNPNIKIQILICHPYAFSIEVVGRIYMEKFDANHS